MRGVIIADMNGIMIATRLTELLDARGKSIYWLSKETGMAYSTMYRLKKSNTDSISFRVLEKICEVLGCEPGDILVRVPDKKPAKK